MRKYEATYILDPNLGDEVVTGTVEKFSQTVVGQGGEVADVRNGGKRRLAYEVKGRGEGIYVTMRFDSETDVAAELRRQLGLADEVLRSLIVQVN